MPIDILPPIKRLALPVLSTCWLLIIVSRNYCYWRMYFWQLIVYPLAVNIWLFVAFHCQWMCVLLSFSFVLESSTLWPRVLYQEFCWNRNWTLSCLILISHCFSSVELNSVCIELFVNTGYFINVFFVYKLNLKFIIGLFCVLDFYLSYWKKLTIQVNCFTHLACYVIPL